MTERLPSGGTPTNWLADFASEILLALGPDHKVLTQAGGALEFFARSRIRGCALEELAQGLGAVEKLAEKVHTTGREARLADFDLVCQGRKWQAQAWVRALEPPIDHACTVVSLLVRPMRPEQAGTWTSRQRAELLQHVAAGLAHEIRNPLSAMRGAAQLLQRDAGRRNDQQSQKLAGLIVDEADRVEFLVAELMDVARPRSLVRGTVELSRLAHERSQAMNTWPEAQNHKIRLELDPSLPAAQGDSELLGRAVDNLLRNALNWSGPGGSVEVATGIEVGDRLFQDGIDRGRLLWLRVSDSGPGVDETLAERIFEPFVSGRENGSGLGLFTTRMVAELHGGQVSFGRSPMGGAAFTFALRERLVPNMDQDERSAP